MKINKKIASVIIFSGLFLLANFTLAQQIPNPLEAGGVTDFSTLLAKIAAGAGLIVTYLSTVMIIVAAIFYLTSAGNPERINTAKKALIYAIVGIAIGISAQVIVNIILGIIKPTP